MATTPAAEAARARPDFGPTLPALVRRHVGVRERLTTIAAAALVAVVAVAVLVHAYVSGPERLVYRAGPTFNIQYSGKVLHRVSPGGQELVRLEGRRGTVSVVIAITRLHLPAYAGNVTSGLLPVYEDRYERGLRRDAVDFVVRDQGSARVNDGQGYQLGFRTGPPGRFTWGRDILLLPGDENVRDGVVLKLRQTKIGAALTKREKKYLDSVHRAFKSFNFGTDRAKW
jgi:hypothetical protein